MAVLGLRFCVRAFSSCGKRGPLFIAVRGPLTIVASLVAEHRFQTHWLSNCGSQAQLLRGMWDPPRPGLEPASPTLAGRLSTTAPPRKLDIFIHVFFIFCTDIFPPVYMCFCALPSLLDIYSSRSSTTLPSINCKLLEDRDRARSSSSSPVAQDLAKRKCGCHN